ncbi:hypothetical protein EOD39_15759 [Acipenser ruthenus]|uniref:Uncharacterized protein n=1 Tax=Acipenser ruthenus TaxID=7906 RepID=A0A444V7G7_ACIRT|nr:hypothetical protein EOD39_15759 [Acipenser ruthenus]
MSWDAGRLPCELRGQCVIIIEGEAETAETSSCTEMGGKQVRIKQEVTSPPDTHSARQDVNKGAYHSQLQYDGRRREAELSRGQEERYCVVVLVERAEWRRHQEDDPVLCPVLQWLEDQQRPS